MRFTTDKQTLDDLNILGTPSGKSVFNLFDHTFTRGGAVLLGQMFAEPLADRTEINKRSGLINFFMGHPFFPFDTELFDLADQYLANIDPRTKLNHDGNSLKNRLGNLLVESNKQKFVYAGVKAIIELLEGLQLFLDAFENQNGHVFREGLQQIQELLDNLLNWPTYKNRQVSYLSYTEFSDYDIYFRFVHRDVLQKILDHIYRLDVYISVGKVALKNGFALAEAVSGADSRMLTLENLHHPLLKNAVRNNFSFAHDRNVTFLTGANMAGKSTFMKSLGIAVYLAHMGFPVPATYMTFAVLDGIYTTINLPDNIGMGTSHFYAEVLRIKKIAKELGQSKRIFVLIDEMFRGTNVKDAHEATILLTEAFAGKRDSMFVISTHIIEAGEILRERCSTIQFIYLPTIMEKEQPIYTHKATAGITNDRHGMLIIENEGILETLKNGNKSICNEF